MQTTTMQTHVHYEQDEPVKVDLTYLREKIYGLDIGPWRSELTLFLTLEQAEQLGQDILTRVQAEKDGSPGSLIETAERETCALVNS